MLEKSNAPPGGSPGGASSVLAKHKRKTHSTDRSLAKAAKVQTANCCLTKSEFEIFRRQYDGATTTFVVNAAGAKLRAPASHRKPARALEGNRIVAMRASRLLNTLGSVARYRRHVGFTSPAAWDGVVALAAELITLRALATSKPATVADLRRWTERNCADAWSSAVQQAWNEVEGMSAMVPTPADAGNGVNLRLEEWLALDRPWGIHPVDATRIEIEGIRSTVKRANDRDRAKARRAKEGARSHAEGIAAFCRRHGLSERTYRHYRSKSDRALSEWLVKNGVSEALPENVAPQSYKKKSRSDVSRQRYQMSEPGTMVCARNAQAIQSPGDAGRAPAIKIQDHFAGGWP